MRSRVAPINLILAILALFLSGCSGPAQPATQATGQTRESGAPKTLTVAYPGEPQALALPISGSGSSIGGNHDLNLAVTQWLVTADDRGDYHPMLASELPSREKGTWLVRPDGTMQTTYRLRPNVLWHDGSPLTAKDFLFSRLVVLDEQLAVSKETIGLTSSMHAPDDQTLIIEWSTTYPLAGKLNDAEFLPLPAHLLERPYLEQRDSFLQLPFWREGFVGVGPYRVAEWEPGSHLTLRAFDGYWANKAKIDRLVFRFMTDPNAVVASLLAGAVDGEIPRAVDFAQGAIVRREWEQAGKRPLVSLQADSWRHVFPQFRSPFAPQVLDSRARLGLLHAIDRAALAGSLLDGETPVAHTFVYRNEPKWEWVKDEVVEHAYDPRRAQQLLAEAGWVRGADSNLMTAAGERVTIPLWTVGGQDTEKAIAVIAEYWKETGAQVDQFVIPRARARDLPFRASFPGFYYAGISTDRLNVLRRMEGRECPRAETQWVGSSLGCYQNPEMDRIVDGLRSAIDVDDERRLWRQAVRIHATEQPALSLFFNLAILVFREGVSGVRPHPLQLTDLTWNVAEWDIR